MNLVVLLEGFLIALLATGVALFTSSFASPAASIGAGFCVFASGLLVLLVAFQLPGDV